MKIANYWNRAIKLIFGTPSVDRGRIMPWKNASKTSPESGN